MTNRSYICIQDINADTSIVFNRSCTFMWLFYCWIFWGFKFTWLHIYFSINCSLFWYMSIFL